MKTQTRYKYEKRIEALQRELDQARIYRSVAIDIYTTVSDLVSKGEGINKGWILHQFRRVMP